MTTNFSKVSRYSSFTTGRYWLSLLKAPKASSQTSQVCQADFSLSWNAETTSQPVKAWKKNIPLLFSARVQHKSCTGADLRFCPWPKAIHNCCRTSVAVFLALTMMTLLPASVHAWHAQRSVCQLLYDCMVPPQPVDSAVADSIFFLGVATHANLSARKLNSSALMSFSLRKFR